MINYRVDNLEEMVAQLSAAVVADTPCITTLPGAAAAVMGIEALIRGEMTVRPLQELHAALREKS
jgi:carbamoyl-phosphate synthase large subunit